MSPTFSFKSIIFLTNYPESIHMAQHWSQASNLKNQPPPQMTYSFKAMLSSCCYMHRSPHWSSRRPTLSLAVLLFWIYLLNLLGYHFLLVCQGYLMPLCAFLISWMSWICSSWKLSLYLHISSSNQFLQIFLWCLRERTLWMLKAKSTYYYNIILPSPPVMALGAFNMKMVPRY